MRWKKVTLIGVGLLGGSLGLALKARRLAGQVVGFVRRSRTAEESLQKGAVDSACLDLGEAVQGSDLIVICTPIAQMQALGEQMLRHVQPGVLVTDVGSVKQSVINALEHPVQEAGGFFVGSHPMAGAEKTGVLHARADLFVDAVCVVTPTPRADPQAVAILDSLWNAVGSRVLHLTPETHDDLVSRSSHLPHVVAAQLANLVLRPDTPKEQGTLCANGFRDSTRIASGSPEMWRDIALANAGNLSRALDEFIEGLQTFRAALNASDEAAITRFFQDAKSRRDAWTGQAHSPE